MGLYNPDRHDKRPGARRTGRGFARPKRPAFVVPVLLRGPPDANRDLRTNARGRPTTSGLRERQKCTWVGPAGGHRPYFYVGDLTAALPTYVVNSFTDFAFSGNPAGVVLLDGSREDSWMQSVGAELRHSETAFLEPLPQRSGLIWLEVAGDRVRLGGHAVTVIEGTLLAGAGVA